MMEVVEQVRMRVQSAVRTRIAGRDFERAHSRIFQAPGPRWFTESDPIWRVHADASMFVGGIRALLLQSLHPRAMAAVSQHSGFRGDPWGRLQRTSAFLATTTYGPIDAAERMISAVNRIHAGIAGVTSDGLPYRADEPHLLAWVHIAELDSFLAAHDHFGARPLVGEERDSYVAQNAEIARRLGVVEPPTTAAALAECLASYRPLLRMTDEARETSALLLRRPPLSGAELAGFRTMASGAISTLPSWARVLLELPTLPITDRLVIRPVTRTTLRGLRWAMAPA
ncbi:MAG: DUF2236 domain-containing protein [Microlunatus sp.]|nr:DUF2236 domain-containing protein [Microlunatus sp.]MDN5771030.1 DUF2236 domain-containing protein [Microlunatus sp.]